MEGSKGALCCIWRTLCGNILVLIYVNCPMVTATATHQHTLTAGSLLQESINCTATLIALNYATKIELVVVAAGDN